MNARPQQIIPALSHSLRSKVAYTAGSVGNQTLDVLLDSGASCSVICKDNVPINDVDPLTPVKLVNADGSDLVPIGTIVMRLVAFKLITRSLSLLVDHLSAPVILGCDFLTKHSVEVDFAQCTFSGTKNPRVCGKLMLSCINSCMLVINGDFPQAIPSKTDMSEVDPDMPTDYNPALESVLREHRTIFKTRVAEHVIETGDAVPVKLPVRPIPFHFKE